MFHIIICKNIEIPTHGIFPEYPEPGGTRHTCICVYAVRLDVYYSISKSGAKSVRPNKFWSSFRPRYRSHCFRCKVCLPINLQICIWLVVLIYVPKRNKHTYFHIYNITTPNPCFYPLIKCSPCVQEGGYFHIKIALAVWAWASN